MAGDRTVKVELLGDAKGLRGAFGDAGSAADGFGSKLGSMGKAVAVAGVALAGGLAVGLASCVKAAAESQKVMAQTEAVIKSTGGSAGLTANQVSDLASKLSTVNPIDDEVIQQAENMLLTFTNIGGTVMPAATQAALDMSVAMGTDAVSASQMLGKALNDPAAGVSKLTKVGVTFTDAQKEQIKTMQEAGDVAGAQGIILAELQKEFGGSAEAAGKTFAGQLTILKTQLGNVQESIGMALIPVLTKLLPYVALAANWLGQRLPGAIALVSGWVGRIADRLSGPLHAAFIMVRDGVLTFVQALQGNWTDDSKIQPLHRAIGLIGSILHDRVIPFVQRVADLFTNVLLPAGRQVIGFLTEHWQQVAMILGGPVAVAIFRFIQSVGDKGLVGALKDLPATIHGVVSSFSQLFGEIGRFVGSLIPPVLAALSNLLHRAIEWGQSTGLPLLLELAGIWGAALVGWARDSVGPALASLADLLGRVAAWAINTGYPMLVEAVKGWANALVAWASDTIPPLLMALDGLLTQARDWIITNGIPAVHDAFAQWTGPVLEAIGKVILAVGDWLLTTGLPIVAAALIIIGYEFVKFVAPIVEPLLKALGDLLLQLGGWLLDTALPAIGAKLIEWGKAFVAWVAPQIPPLLVELGALLLSLGDWLITTALPAILEKLGQWAAAFIAWVAPQIPPLLVELGALLLAVGDWLITTALPEIVTKLGEWAAAFLDWVATDVVPFIAEKLEGFLGAVKSWFGDEASGAISTAKGYAKDLGKGIINGVVAGIDAIWSTFTGKIDAIGTYVSGVIDGIKRAISGVIGGINGAIDTINSALDFSVTSPGLSILGKQVVPSFTFSFNPPDIPNIPDPFGGSSGSGGGNAGPQANANFMADSITNAPPYVGAPSPFPPLGGGPTPYPGAGGGGGVGPPQQKPVGGGGPGGGGLQKPVPGGGTPGAPLPAPWEQAPNPLANMGPVGGKYGGGGPGGFAGGAYLKTASGYAELAAVIKQAMKDGMREAMSGAMG